MAGVNFSRAAAKRIGEAVRHVERSRVGGSKQRRPLLPPPGPFWVRVAGNETGTGVYYGYLLSPSNQTIDPAAPPADTTWLDSTGEEIVILNHGPLEDGHVLTDTTDGVVTQTDFMATWNGTTTDDPPRRVAIILGLNPYTCS
jgi:hypothetical protein